LASPLASALLALPLIVQPALNIKQARYARACFLCRSRLAIL
jgi:hypothetical protein